MKDETHFKRQKYGQKGPQNHGLPFLETHVTIPLSEISTTISTNLDNNIKINNFKCMLRWKKFASTYWRIRKATPIHLLF